MWHSKRTRHSEAYVPPIQRSLDDVKKNKYIIYKVPRKNCDLVSIGETARDHNMKHAADFTNIETLDDESDWRRRVIRDNLLTRQHLSETITQVKHEIRVFE